MGDTGAAIATCDDERACVAFGSPADPGALTKVIAPEGLAAIAAGPGGSATVAWMSGGSETSREVKAATVTTSGFGPVMTLRSGVAADNVKVAVGHNGGAVVAWQEKGADYSTQLVAATRPPGGAFGPARVVAETWYAFAAELAAGGSRAAIAYQTDGKNFPAIAFADLATGDGFSPPRLLTSAYGGSAFPSIDVAPSGETLAVWGTSWGNTYAAWADTRGEIVSSRAISCSPRFNSYGYVSAAAGRHAAILGTDSTGALAVLRTTPGNAGPDLRCYEPTAPYSGPPVELPGFPAPAFKVPAKLKLDRKGRFNLRIDVVVPSYVSAKGYVRLKGLNSRLGLKPIRKRSLSPAGNTLTLQVHGAEARALARKHRRGGKVRVEVSVRELIGPRPKPTKFNRTLVLGRSR
jgi:hypothetical protein